MSYSDGQISMFEYLHKQKPKAENQAKIGERIFFVGYRGWINAEDEYSRDLSAYRCKAIDADDNSFKAELDKKYVYLKQEDYKKKWFYFREEAEAKRIEIVSSAYDGKRWKEAAGLYLCRDEDRDRLIKFYAEVERRLWDE